MIPTISTEKISPTIWDGTREIVMPPKWRVRIGDRIIMYDHEPTDDDLVAALPARPTRLEPTAAAGKVALRDLLDEQVQEAAAWDWFAAKCVADAAFPAAAKTAAQTLADNEYQRAKRLLQAWRQAT